MCVKFAAAYDAMHASRILCIPGVAASGYTDTTDTIYSFFSGIKRLASRAITQRPSEFLRKIVRVKPERRVGFSASGLIVTLRRFRIHAQFPAISIS
jgi:hypothetical protein